MTRALDSKTRPSIELQELKIHDQVDFFRPPDTKDESGWKGPAELIEILDGAATIRWQRQHLRVRAQDLRRSLAFIYFVCILPVTGQDDHRQTLSLSLPKHANDE